MRLYEMLYFSNHKSFGGELTRLFHATSYDDAVAQANAWLAVPLNGETETHLIAVYLA
jgi:hypothetical protein